MCRLLGGNQKQGLLVHARDAERLVTLYKLLLLWGRLHRRTPLGNFAEASSGSVQPFLIFHICSCLHGPSSIHSILSLAHYVLALCPAAEPLTTCAPEHGKRVASPTEMRWKCNIRT